MLQTKTYSVGSFDRYTGTSHGYILDLILTEESIDTAANTSLLSYKLQLRSGPSNRFDWELTAALSLNGTAVAQVTAENDLDYNSVWVLLEGQATVPHGPDGSLDMAFCATLTPWNGGNSYAPPELTLHGTMALTQVARASAVAATPAYIGDVSTVVISRRDAGCTHSLFYRFGGLSGYLADATGQLSDAEVKLTDTTVLFPVPEAFYYEIPDAPSGVCTLTCTTYDGDTPIGQPQTATFTVTADPARCGPVVSGAVEDVCSATLALTGDSRILVQGQSAAKCTPAVTTRYGAALKELCLNGVPIENAAQTVADVTAAGFTFRATDSRGYTAACTVEALTVIAYTPVSATAAAARTDPTSGQAVLRVTGKWYNGAFGAQENALRCRYRVNGGSWSAADVTTDAEDFTVQAALSGLDYQHSHTVDVEVSDKLQTVSKSVTVSKGIPVFDWGEEDFAFHVPVRFTAADGTVFTLDLLDGQLTAIIT